MANTNAPFGFSPVQDRTDARLEAATLAGTYATKLGRGDPIELSGSGTDVARSAAGSEAILGIFWGVEYLDAQGSPQWSMYWPGSVGYTDVKVQYVPITSNVTFRVQCDTCAAGDVGAIADFEVHDADATKRLSQSMLDVSSVVGTSGKSFMILRLADIPNNAYGAYAVVEGVFVEGAHISGTGV